MSTESKLETAEKKFNRLINILWGLAIFLGIGSITSILTVNKIIDNKVTTIVAKQSASIDQFITAIDLARNGDSKGLQLLVTTWNNIDIKPSEALTNYYFRNLIWMLSTIEIENEMIILNSSPIWNELKNNNDFNALKLSSSDDENFNYTYALCILLFESDYTFIQNARNRIVAALNESKFLRRSEYLYVLAILDLIEDNVPEAIIKLEEAHEIDPALYNINDYEKYVNSFLNSSSYSYWNYVYQKTLKINMPEQPKYLTFKELYLDFLIEIKAHNNRQDFN